MRSCVIMPLAIMGIFFDTAILVKQAKGGDPVSHCFIHGAKALVAPVTVGVR
jgi:hypothetical protein